MDIDFRDEKRLSFVDNDKLWFSLSLSLSLSLAGVRENCLAIGATVVKREGSFEKFTALFAG